MTEPISFVVKTEEVIQHFMSKLDKMSTFGKSKIIEQNPSNSLYSFIKEDYEPVAIDIILRLHDVTDRNELKYEIAKFNITEPTFSYYLEHGYDNKNMYTNIIATIYHYSTSKLIIEKRLQQATPQQLAITWLSHQDDIPPIFMNMFQKYRERISS